MKFHDGLYLDDVGHYLSVLHKSSKIFWLFEMEHEEWTKGVEVHTKDPAGFHFVSTLGPENKKFVLPTEFFE